MELCLPGEPCYNLGGSINVSRFPFAHLAALPADMRIRFDGLAALAKTKLQEQAHGGDWFVSSTGAET